MAYENQEKCIECGKSIPKPPEYAAYLELLCEACASQPYRCPVCGYKLEAYIF